MNTGPTGNQAPTPDEAQRMELAQRVRECIGDDGESPIGAVLREVLPYDPTVAEAFIRTEMYAAEVSGEKRIWYTVRHFRSSRGYRGTRRFQSGDEENLTYEGYTAYDLIEMIRAILDLRTCGLPGREFYFDCDKISRLIAVYDTAPEERTGDYYLKGKVLEVMGVTEEEIELLAGYNTACTLNDDKISAARILEERARIARSEGAETVRDAKNKMKEYSLARPADIE